MPSHDLPAFSVLQNYNHLTGDVCKTQHNPVPTLPDIPDTASTKHRHKFYLPLPFKGAELKRLAPAL